MAIERREFDNQLRDLLPHLYDLAYLETHPLAGLLPRRDGSEGSRGEALRQVVVNGIEGLKPAGKPYEVYQIEWRPYVILYKRYVEGTGINELSDLLALGRRQVRRDHSRAVQALAHLLWDQSFRQAVGEGERVGEIPAGVYALQLEALDVGEVLLGIAGVMSKRMQAEEVSLSLNLPDGACTAVGDKTVLRQIVIAALNYALHITSGSMIDLSARAGANSIRLLLEFDLNEQWNFWVDQVREDLLDNIQFWCDSIQAEFVDQYPPPGEAGKALVWISLPAAGDSLVVVVDDQEPAQRMYRRYLERYAFHVVGIQDAAIAVRTCAKLLPGLIMLDVMMPQVDGWEILQSLKSSSQTSEIPVLVCSAWAEPELAFSLGASGFLKKPVTQKDLLGELTRLGLLPLDTPAEA